MKVTALIIEREKPASVSGTVWDIVKDNPSLPRNTLVHLCVAAGVNPNSARTMVAEFQPMVLAGRKELSRVSIL